MGKQRGERALGGMLRLSQMVLVGFLALGCDGGGAAEVTADAQAPAVGRPEGASGGPRVGVVVLASPDVRVRPSRGPEFSAGQGVMLVRDDTLATTADPKSFVVVELYNGHLVRFNHESQILVEKIAVFDAPRAGDDLAQRFEKVLRPEELQNAEMRGAISRVAGWNSRMTASETIAALPASQLASPPPPPVESKSDTQARGGEPEAPGLGSPESSPIDPMDAPVAERMPEPSRPDEPKKASKSSRRDDGATEPVKNKLPSAEEGNDRPTDGDSKQPAKKSDKQSGSEPSSPDAGDSAPLDLPAKVSFTPEGGAMTTIDLPIALSFERAQLARCAGRGALLRAKVVKGLITEIVIDNGKRCSLETSRALKLADGWLEMRVK